MATPDRLAGTGSNFHRIRQAISEPRPAGEVALRSVPRSSVREKANACGSPRRYYLKNCSAAMEAAQQSVARRDACEAIGPRGAERRRSCGMVRRSRCRRGPNEVIPEVRGTISTRAAGKAAELTVPRHDGANDSENNSRWPRVRVQARDRHHMIGWLLSFRLAENDELERDCWVVLA